MHSYKKSKTLSIICFAILFFISGWNTVALAATCSTSNDCPGYCDLIRKQCACCTGNASCSTRTDGKKSCDLTSKTCVECAQNSDCTGPNQFCNLKTNTCIDDFDECKANLANCNSNSCCANLLGKYKCLSDADLILANVNPSSYQWPLEAGNTNKYEEKYKCKMYRIKTAKGLFVRHTGWKFYFFDPKDIDENNEQLVNDISYCLHKIDPNSTSANLCKEKAYCYAIIAKHHRSNEIRKFNSSYDFTVDLSKSSGYKEFPSATLLSKLDDFGENDQDLGRFTIYPLGSC